MLTLQSAEAGSSISTPARRCPLTSEEVEELTFESFETDFPDSPSRAIAERLPKKPIDGHVRVARPSLQTHPRAPLSNGLRRNRSTGT